MRDCINTLVPGLAATWKGPVAGYIDSQFAWGPADWGKFSGRKVRISDQADPLAEVMDWETGNAPLPAVKAAVTRRYDIGLSTVVYCSESKWQQAKPSLAGLPVAWWVAHWVGPPPPKWWFRKARWWRAAGVPPETCAIQFASFPTFDESLVNTAAWPDWA